MKLRHLIIMLSFIGVVFSPTLVAAYYLFFFAANQYSSNVGFSVRSVESPSANNILGSISNLKGVSTGGSKDSDVLFEFIQSQQMVEYIDARINLRHIYTKPSNDPIFSFNDDGSIEDLLDYWGHMVKIYYDSGTGLIELRVNAFTAQDARIVAQEIFDASSRMINELSSIARDDSTRYAKEELEKTLAELKQARKNITLYRTRTQIVDPTADVQGQMGLLTSLQSQLAETLINFDLLNEVTRNDDPRVEQAKRKIGIIQRRIEEERKKIGLGNAGGDETFSDLVGQYEALMIDQEFAEQSYLAARVLYETALSEARRQSRYLAAYVKPTLAETPEYPKRLFLVGTIAAMLAMAWAIIVLIIYSIKDRR